MYNKKSNTGKIILIVVLVMLILFGGSLLLLSSMGYVRFGKESNHEEITKDDNTCLLSEDSALSIVRDKVPRYLEYYYSFGVYCGELDKEDYISFGSYENNDFRDYYASVKFNSIDELKKYYSSFMIDDLFSNRINDENSYIEQNGKLYCELYHNDFDATYDDESFIINSIDENKIVSEFLPGSFDPITIVITKNSMGNWLVSDYYDHECMDCSPWMTLDD